MGLKTRHLASGQVEDNEFNISLLGFKMAVNEGLTVFNLVDGIVDEFHDESGTDEGEGSNDDYCASSDFYTNCNASAFSAGFAHASVTEEDTSETASGNYTTGTAGTYTVPACITAICAFLWGAGGSGTDQCEAAIAGGGGGFSKGTLAVTASQTFKVIVGEGGMQNHFPQTDRAGAFFGGGGGEGMNNGSGYGGGLSAILSQTTGFSDDTDHTPSCIPAPAQAPYVYFVAGAGGGGGGHISTPHGGDFAGIPGISCGSGGGGAPTGDGYYSGGAGGGLIGLTAGLQQAQTDAIINTEGPEYSPLPISSGWASTYGHYLGGGGSQTAGGQAGGGEPAPQYGGGFSGQFFEGGAVHGHNQPNKCHPLATGPGDHNMGSGGAGYYGGGAGGYSPQPESGNRSGGGGSSYIGHPQITSGSTEAGLASEGGGSYGQPNYVACTNEGAASLPQLSPGAGETNRGENGYVLITGSATQAKSTTIVSNAFSTSGIVPTASRIVVFEEDIGTPTLNTDIIASISRDGGSTYTTATLTDSGYVTGSSGQRILTGQAVVSGQPSGQSMRWKLALANNAVKIHGVSLQWS